MKTLRKCWSNYIKASILFATIAIVTNFYSCRSSNYKEKSVKRAEFIISNMEDVLKCVENIKKKYVLDFRNNTRYVIVKSKKDNAFRDMIYDDSVNGLFDKLEINEISLEKNIRCDTMPNFSEIILADKNGQTTYHYYKCKYPFNYSDEVDNDLAYTKKLRDNFAVVYEK